MQKNGQKRTTTELRLKNHKSSVHVCMQFFRHHTQKNALASLQPLFLVSSFTFAVAEAFKGAIYMHFSHCFSQFSFIYPARWKKKEIHFNEWKFMHMRTSNNSSNQGNFNKRFYFVDFGESCVSTSFGEWLWWQKKFCDDIRFNKQLNKAESTFLLQTLSSSSAQREKMSVL